MSRIRTSAGTFCSAWCLWLSACGAPGDPLPPALNIPARSTDLEAVQRADELIVRWTAPALNTEGLPAKSIARSVLLGVKVEGEAVEEEAFSSQSLELAVREEPEPGERIERSIELPAEPGQRVALAVRNLDRRGRSEGLSNVVVVEIAVAPPAPPRVRALAQADAVRVEWDPAERAHGYQVYRAEGEKGRFSPLATVGAPPFEDREFRWKTPYRYFVRAFAKTATGVVESADSVVASISPEDTFPPSIPSGLRAVVGDGAVNLSWNLSPEPDTAGYNVYRQGVRVNPSPVAAPAYADRDIQSSRQYEYSVSAVDDKGNESLRSEPLLVTVP